MSYEVDWRAVGGESKSGDCIAFRFGNFLSDPKDQIIVVIDGGFRETGEGVVKLIKEVYGSNRVDLVISTHPDIDHLSGLNAVLEELKVGELWMHKPWERRHEIRTYLTEGLISKAKFDEAVRKFSVDVRKSLTGANNLAKLAGEKGIPIYEPFQGRQAFNGVLTILGPTQDFYNQTLAEASTTSSIQEAYGTIKEGIVGLAEKALTWIDEKLDVELLTEPDENATSPRNNSSVISLAKLEDKAFMFTADAGVPALVHAADYAESLGYLIASGIIYVQVPHHGSRRNVGPSILDRLYGPRVSQEAEKREKVAMVLAAKQGAPKHPNGRVINALNRRGIQVEVTTGQDIVSRSAEVPMRKNWGPVTPVGFQPRYQDEE